MEKRFLFIHGFLGSPENGERLRKDLNIATENWTAWDLQKDFLQTLASNNANLFDVWTKEAGEKIKSYKDLVGIGYSLGGRLLANLFLGNSDQFKKIFLLSTNPGLQNVEEKDFRFKTDQEWSEKLLKLSATEFLKDWNTQGVFSDDFEDPEWKIENLQVWKKILLGFSVSHQKNLRAEITLQQQLQKIAFLVGEKDQKYLDIYQDWRQQQPALDLRLIKNVGHRLLSRSGAIASEIQDFK